MDDNTLMVELIKSWYQRKLSDPNAVALVIILLVFFTLVLFMSHLLMPVFVAIALAFLLDLPIHKLTKLGLPRTSAVTLVVFAFVGISLFSFVGLLPIVWRQSTNLLHEVPHMLDQGQAFLLTLPDKYPEFIRANQIESVIAMINEKFIEWGQLALKASLNSISDVVALMVYLILVPLMMFFFLKDKALFNQWLIKVLPRNRRMAHQVANEMNQQILNYIRGKIVEILIVGVATTLAFIWLNLQYAVLLGVLVGLSVLVPYVGATVVTIPVVIVGLFQFGVSPEFGYVMLAYGIIQAIDGNVIVPLLFSEAVNLHPAIIIIAVIFFGGLWGFWGVFFAIPLATLVKAVINAWPSNEPTSD